MVGRNVAIARRFAAAGRSHQVQREHRGGTIEVAMSDAIDQRPEWPSALALPAQGVGRAGFC